MLNQKGFAPLFIILGLALIGIFGGGFYYYQAILPRSEEVATSVIPSPPSPPPPSIASDMPLPTANTTTPFYVNSFEDALKNVDRTTGLFVCDKKLMTVPVEIGTLTKLEALDLSENNLTLLPNEIKKLTALKELILVNNNFSINEQTRIKQLMPSTKIAFVPQKNFNPFLADSWKTYTNNQYGFTFKYHPELTITENNKGLDIASDLGGSEMAYMSCSVENAYINLSITIEDNPNNLPPTSYLEKIWDTRITLQGDKYIAEKAMIKMIGEIKKYKNGELEGVIADAGESEHPSIVTSHNNKFYIFRYMSGGETGSRVPDIAKKTLDQSLATFKYTN